MPGMLFHFAFAKEVYKFIRPDVKMDKVLFMSGNIIPDLSAADKNMSHFRIPASVKGILVPDMDKVSNLLYDVKNPILFGMYSHLYLDYKFLEEFLIPRFTFNFIKNEVTSKRNGLKWDVNSFFSPKGLYGAYGEINQLLIRDGHVSLNEVYNIPENLPNTGIQLFDIRRKMSWREEMEKYLSRKPKYTGDTIDYNDLWLFIKDAAKNLSKEI